MKYLVILSLIAFHLTGCSDNSVTGETAQPKELYPVYSEKEETSADDYSVETIEEITSIPKVTLNPDDVVIDLIDTNLDLDADDEQLLIVKNNGENDSRIRIIVADYDYVIGSYSITWEAETGSVNIRSFSINLKDIIGDHNLEIVCSGIDASGNTTLDIYRRTPSPGGLVLFYQNILNLDIDGNIEILEKARTQAYQSGVSDGISFSVMTTAPDLDSENELDLIQRTYLWRNQNGKYVLVSEEKIPGEEIEDQKLRELNRNDEAYFNNFLSGPWMLAEGESDITYNNPIVFFDPENSKIVFSNSEIQEVYLWKTSNKTYRTTLLVTCENDLVPFLDVSITISVVDLNTINVRFRDNSIRTGKSPDNQSWTGSYFRMSKEIQIDLIEDYRYAEKMNSSPDLSGFYRSDTGDEIFFDSPRFMLKTNDQEVHGSFYLVDQGLKIAEFRTLDANNLTKETNTYKYDYFEDTSDTEIIRTLVMIPGSMTINGFIPSGEQFVRYQQIEQIEIPDNTAQEVTQ